MDRSLNEKVALVCGSSRGIGKSIAYALSQLGATIILVARNEEKLKIVKQELDIINKKENYYLVADLSNPAIFRNALEKFLISFESPIHILINNTGGPAAGPITDASDIQFLEAFSAHLICNQIAATMLLPGMKSAEYGRIINIISTSVKAPLHNLGVSNTIRGAVANWSKTWANEVGKFGITVNNVLPGATGTERLENIIENKIQKTGKSKETVENEMLNEIPMHRFAKPEEIANAVAFLASPLASYITGINLPVDGGRTASL